MGSNVVTWMKTVLMRMVVNRLVPWKLLENMLFFSYCLYLFLFEAFFWRSIVVKICSIFFWFGLKFQSSPMIGLIGGCGKRVKFLWERSGGCGEVLGLGIVPKPHPTFPTHRPLASLVARPPIHVLSGHTVDGMYRDTASQW